VTSHKTTKRVLIIKTTSLGDVIHILPAIAEAAKNNPDLVFDWVVEDTFSEVPNWHLNIENVYEVSIRQWRKNFYKPAIWKAIKKSIGQIRQHQYDYVIDAQGLSKSAIISLFAKGETYGLDKHSAREGWVSRFYKHKIPVPKGTHAITRLQQFFGKVFHYEPNMNVFDSGIRHKWQLANLEKSQVLFLHGTTWKTKHWPEDYWNALAGKLSDDGYQVLLPWGSESEKQRAERVSLDKQNVEVLPKMSLSELAKKFSEVSFIISVDTGLSHLAAACDTPIISIYGATSPVLTGSKGNNQIYLTSDLDCAPCFKRSCKISDDTYPPCLQGITVLRIMAEVLALEERLGGKGA